MDRDKLFKPFSGLCVPEHYPQTHPLTPDSINYFFLRQGHVIEYYQPAPGQKRIVVFFWEAPDCVIPCHAYDSILEPLDKIDKMTITYGGMIMALRRFPLMRDFYQVARWKYHQKMEARLHTLSHLGPKERLAKLEMEHPWVFNLVREEDIANYLRLNVGILRRLRGR
jgi:hypothetical protein